MNHFPLLLIKIIMMNIDKNQLNIKNKKGIYDKCKTVLKNSVSPRPNTVKKISLFSLPYF